MISLHFEVSQRIKRLVQQDNFSETLCEAEQFAQMNGDETKVVYVASLLDEMGDGKKSRDQINAQKVSLDVKYVHLSVRVYFDL
jgi:dephospho-CoA kinase